MKFRYGNYCGPGPDLSDNCEKLANGNPLPQPINSIDNVCKKHDIFYCKCGSKWQHGVLGSAGSECSRKADSFMQKEIEDLLPELSGNERVIALLILNYFKTHGIFQKLTHRNQMLNGVGQNKIEV